MIHTHSIKLYPNNKQETFFRRSCGVARFSYNWALANWKELYEKGEKPSAYTLIKLQNAIKRMEYPWMLYVGKCAPQYAIHNLESAFKKMWKDGSGYPRFKKKGVKDTFVAVENCYQFKQTNKKIWIPRLGWVRCAEDLRFEGKVNNIVVKRIADHWFACVNIEIPKETPVVSENQAIIGVDLGIKSMAVTSDGQVFENPRALRSKLKSLKRHQRSLSRKVKGSKNRFRQRMHVARLHYKISCIRNTSIHQVTTSIVNSAGIIVLEDLAVRNMVKNHHIAQAISDVSPSEFRRQIEYKAKWQGKTVIIADRFFPSSKTCSCCGWKDVNQTLSDRVFNCQQCGMVINRDLNAAKNLARYGSTAKYAESEACGEGSSVSETIYSPSVKQEVESLK